MTLIDQIRDMIAKGETEKSLNELYNYVRENNADIIDNLVMLRSRMQRLQSQKLNGTINNEGEAIEQAKINEAILKLLPQLTPEYLAQARQHIAPTHQIGRAQEILPNHNRKRLYIIGGAAILFAFILINFINSRDNNNVQNESLGGDTNPVVEHSLPNPVIEDQLAEKQPSGKAKDVSIGVDGSIWIIDEGHDIKKWLGEGWKQVDGKGARIAISEKGEPWTCGLDNKIYEYESEKNNWKLHPGEAEDIAISPEGVVWAIGDGGLLKWDPSGEEWKNYGGAAYRITVDIEENP